MSTIWPHSLLLALQERCRGIAIDESTIEMVPVEILMGTITGLLQNCVSGMDLPVQ
jgi:hypothetical protein